MADYEDKGTYYDVSMQVLAQDAGIEESGFFTRNFGGWFGMDHHDNITDAAEEAMFNASGGSYAFEEGIGETLARLQAVASHNPDSPEAQQYAEIVTYLQENPPGSEEAVKGLLETIGTHMSVGEQTGIALSLVGVNEEQTAAFRDMLEQDPALAEAMEAVLAGNPDASLAEMTAEIQSNQEFLQLAGTDPEAFSGILTGLGADRITQIMSAEGDMVEQLTAQDMAGVMLSVAGIEGPQRDEFIAALNSNTGAQASLLAMTETGPDGADLSQIVSQIRDNTDILEVAASDPSKFMTFIAELGPEATKNLMSMEGGEPEQVTQFLEAAMAHPETAAAVLNSDVFASFTAEHGFDFEPEAMASAIEELPLDQKIDFLFEIAAAQNPELAGGKDQFKEQLNAAIEADPTIETSINQAIGQAMDGGGELNLSASLGQLETISTTVATLGASEVGERILSDPESIQGILNFASGEVSEQVQTVFNIFAPQADPGALVQLIEENEGLQSKLGDMVGALAGGAGEGVDLTDMGQLSARIEAIGPILTAAAENPEKFSNFMEAIEAEDVVSIVNAFGGSGGDPAQAGQIFEQALDHPETVAALVNSDAFAELTASEVELDLSDPSSLSGALEAVGIGAKIDLLFEVAASTILGEGGEMAAENAQALLDHGDALKLSLDNLGKSERPEDQQFMELLNEYAGTQLQGLMGGETTGTNLFATLEESSLQLSGLLELPAFGNIIADERLRDTVLARAQETQPVQVGEELQHVPIGFEQAATDVYTREVAGRLFTPLMNGGGLQALGLVNSISGGLGNSQGSSGLFGYLQTFLTAERTGNVGDTGIMMQLAQNFLGGENDLYGHIYGVGDNLLGRAAMAELSVELGLPPRPDDDMYRLVNEMYNQDPNPSPYAHLRYELDDDGKPTGEVVGFYTNEQIEEMRASGELTRMAEAARLEMGDNALNAYKHDGSVRTVEELQEDGTTVEKPYEAPEVYRSPEGNMREWSQDLTPGLPGAV